MIKFNSITKVSLSLIAAGALLTGCDAMSGLMYDTTYDNPTVKSNTSNSSSQSVTYRSSSTAAGTPSTQTATRQSQPTPTSTDPKPAVKTEAGSGVPLEAPAVGQ